MKTPRFSARQPCRQQPLLLPHRQRLAVGAHSRGPVHLCGEGKSRRRHRRPAAAHRLLPVLEPTETLRGREAPVQAAAVT